MGRLRRWAIQWLNNAASIARALAEWLTPSLHVVNDGAMAALHARYPDAPEHWLRMLAERAPHLAEPDPLDEMLRGPAPPPFDSVGHRQPPRPDAAFASPGQQPARDIVAGRDRDGAQRKPGLAAMVRRRRAEKREQAIAFERGARAPHEASPIFGADERPDAPASPRRQARPATGRTPPDLVAVTGEGRKERRTIPFTAAIRPATHTPFMQSGGQLQTPAPFDRPAQTRGDRADPAWPSLPTPSLSSAPWAMAARDPAPAETPRWPEPEDAPRQAAQHAAAPPPRWPALPPVLGGFEDVAEAPSRLADLIAEQEAGRWSA